MAISADPFSALGAIAILTDAEHRVTWANDGFSQTTGHTLSLARDHFLADLLAPLAPDGASAVNELRAAAGHPQRFRITVPLVRADGSRFWLRLEGQPMRDDTGAPSGFLVLGSDGTAQAERETALQRKEALFNEAQRIAQIGSWDHDLRTRREEWSAETFRILGFSSREPGEQRALAESFIDEHRAAFDAALTQCREMGVPFDLELRIRRVSGELRWVRCLGRATTRGGRVVRVAGTLQDIDERKQRELEVAGLAERMTLAAKFAGIGIWEYNHATGELIWDDAMLALHRMHRDAFPGDFSVWHLVMLPEDRAAEAQMRRAFDEGAREFDVEYRILTSDDEIRYIRNCGRIVRDASGRILRSYGVNYDITQERVNMIALLESDENLREANASLQATIEQTQRLAEAAEDASRAKTAFLATISHEIRTPLNGVIGMTNILAGTPLTDEQRDYLDTIRLSGQSLLTLINDTLDYSKIEAGRVELECRPFDIVACVKEAIDLVAPHAEHKQLALTQIVAADVPSVIEGDASRLRQILVNLLANAIKFTAEGGVTLEVYVDAFVADEATLVFDIIDTGIGIPKDQQSRLFESFSQADASITRTHGGTGLGLAISRRLAELMGGTVWFDSEPGRGSTFHASIHAPIVIEEALCDHPACMERLAGRRVLVVADDASREHLERHVRSAGVEVAGAADAEAALALIARGERHDLIVSIGQLPGMSGLAFTRQLHTRGLPRIPLLSENQVGALTDASAPRLHQLMASRVPPPEPTNPASSEPTQFERIGDTMPLSILMAEDNTVNQRVAQLTLRRLGYEVEIVSDGAESLGALQRRHFDVVLMDVQMPEMDGLEATRRIRAMPEHRLRPWIIALTASAFEEDRLAALGVGMNDFISKPIRVDLLKAALQRAWEALKGPPPDWDAPTTSAD